ncbi:MAG: hypothetical protein WC584_01380 [Candidatus Pacearchaeota archaeon]
MASHLSNRLETIFNIGYLASSVAVSVDNLSNGYSLDPEGKGELRQFSRIFYRLSRGFEQGRYLVDARSLSALEEIFGTADFVGLFEQTSLMALELRMAERLGYEKQRHLTDKCLKVSRVCTRHRYDELRGNRLVA